MKKKYVSILLAGCMAVSMMTPAGEVWADENPVVAAQGTVQGEKTGGLTKYHQEGGDL